MHESVEGASLRVCGVSFRRTPVSMRERVAVRPERLGFAVGWLREQPGVREAMVLSTCNRTELYLSADDPLDGRSLFARFASGLGAVEVDPERDGVYELRGAEAVRHLFRVASSLDSLVVGEPQILGQTKEAFRAAESEGTIGRDLHPWLSKALATAKEVRAKTALAQGATSVAAAAVELAGRVFENLQSKSVLLVGAGEMGQAAASQLQKAGVCNLALASRSVERARRAATTCDGTAISFDERVERAVEADVVICSAAAERFVLDAAQVSAIMRCRPERPLVVLDIAVPRNVDPEAGRLDGVFLFNIDNLEEIVEANRTARAIEAERAEEIVSRSTEQFLRQLRQSQVGPAIAAVREHVRSICEEELLALEARNPELRGEQSAELQLMLHRMAQKILHPIICELKGMAERSAEPPEREPALGARRASTVGAR